MLKQEIAFFEKNNVEQLPSQIGELFFIVTQSIGEKLSNIIFSAACIIASAVTAFVKGADFAGICVAFLPIILVIMGVFGTLVKRSTTAKMAVTKRLGGVIEESLGAIRLVSSFANEDKEIDKFQKLAREVQ